MLGQTHSTNTLSRQAPLLPTDSRTPQPSTASVALPFREFDRRPLALDGGQHHLRFERR